MLYFMPLSIFETNVNTKVTEFLDVSENMYYLCIRFLKKIKNVFGYKMRYPCFMVSFLNVSEDHIVRWDPHFFPSPFGKNNYELLINLFNVSSTNLPNTKEKIFSWIFQKIISRYLKELATEIFLKFSSWYFIVDFILIFV